MGWTETVLHAAHVYFTMIELDMRSAQNTLRMIRALKGEELPYEKLRYVLNRAPGFTDLNGKSRVKRMGLRLRPEACRAAALRCSRWGFGWLPPPSA